MTFFKLHPDYMSEVVVPGQVQPAKKVKQSNPLRQLESLSRNRLSDQAITQVKWCESQTLVAAVMNH